MWVFYTVSIYYVPFSLMLLHLLRCALLYLSVCLRGETWQTLQVEKRAFSGALCGCASRRSGTSAQAKCHSVPVSPWDVPKERGKRQPPPTLPIHHHDTTSCSHGKPTAGQSLWTRAGGRRGWGVETGLAIH